MSIDQRIRVYSVVSDPFRYGFLVMARTLLEHNPGLEIEFCVLYHERLSPLAEKYRAWLGRRIPGVSFHRVDLSPYANIFQLRDEFFETPRRLWAAFLVLDAFADDSDDAHVLCLDSDLVCMGPLGDDLFENSGFAAVEARSSEGDRLGYFNTGVMAIGRLARGPEQFRRLMETTDASPHRPDRGRADQALLALWYTPTNAGSLRWRYNLTKRQVPTRGVRDALTRRDAVFFHYVGAKPWHVSLDRRDLEDHEAVALWDEIVAEQLNEGEMVEYLEFWQESSRIRAREYFEEREFWLGLRSRRLQSMARYAVRRARDILDSRRRT